MCYNIQTSLRALTFGVFSGLILMKFGKQDYHNINTVLGIFFIFISFMQYIEYLIWTDLSCTNGNNKFAGTLGPLLNYLQPTFLFILIIIILKNNNITNADIVPIILHISYLSYILYEYCKYQNKGNLCSNVKDKHLSWIWKDKYNYILYQIVIIFTILYYLHDVNSQIAFGLAHVYFFFTLFKFDKNVGELWCYTGVTIPLIILTVQHTLL